MAARLGYIHIDTGAMYRALTWLALQKGIDPSDEAALGELAQKARIRFSLDAAGRQLTWCEEEDVTEAIRTSSVSRFVSVIAAIPAVRQALVEQQRRLACRQNVVMDGRDIGTVVLPKAECKIFLTASPQERALRRAENWPLPAKRWIWMLWPGRLPSGIIRTVTAAQVLCARRRTRFYWILQA